VANVEVLGVENAKPRGLPFLLKIERRGAGSGDAGK
jgi:hypothetical protein